MLRSARQRGVTGDLLETHKSTSLATHSALEILAFLQQNLKSVQHSIQTVTGDWPPDNFSALVATYYILAFDIETVEDSHDSESACDRLQSDIKWQTRVRVKQ